MDIIRPVAFRPYASRKSDKWQTVISSSFSFYNSNKKNDFLTKRLSKFVFIAVSFYDDYNDESFKSDFYWTYYSSDDLKRSSQHSKDTMSNSSAPSSGYGSTRPRAIYQPSTRFGYFERASCDIFVLYICAKNFVYFRTMYIPFFFLQSFILKHNS
ncbi:hypothetical protein WUBG_12707 [Wuchereria bancrofti]|uniref:Uncharacterized protein n=1 Tax=Wuchereria bancrofti TaxID=6293 RepID=J9EH85_WUCBA|nr:hypothetical protein WUBG_12707 [Wuchereria bancrofti]